MVMTLAVNSNNDLYLGKDGNIATLQGLPAVEQCCATATKSILAEQIYAVQAGLPMFQTIWDGSPNVSLYVSYLQNTLSNVPDVTAVNGITTDISNNTFTYTANIQTSDGTGTATATISR